MTETFDAGRLQRWLTGKVAERAGISPAEIDADRPFVEYGLTSRDAVALSGELEDLLDRTLPATIFWEHPTIGLLVQGLGTGAEPQTTSRTASAEPIAVVGLGCRLPGGVRNPQDFWRLLLDGGDAIGRVPEDRWDSFDDGSPETAVVLGQTTRWGGFLDDVAGFDAEFFGISPREAATMDPQQRLLLEVSWEALEHAGLAPGTLRGSATGVFVGVSASEYSHLTASDVTQVEAWTGTGAATSIIAGRLSYQLDLRGPSLTVDTACSSSLVAVHQAVQSLRSGESDAALAAGVNLLLSPAVTATFDRAGAMAADGRCKTFDAAADGYVRGEGCGVVVLKRLTDAQRDGDRVLAVLRGSAVNSDGRSNGLMAPRTEAQAAVLRTAYTAADLEPGEVDYVEAHGTGTPLGDPIELSALGSVLGAGRPVERPLLVGSVKTNVGHLEAAAGVTGLIKVVLAMVYRRIPANLHFQAPNPRIPFEENRLRVVTETTPWPRADQRARAGVSSFGFGGTNAHVVVEEAPRLAAPAGAPAPAAPVERFVLSAPTAARVGVAAGSLAMWLGTGGSVAPLGAVASTLARRYPAGRARAAVAARTRDELIAGLQALAGGDPAPGVVTALAEPSKTGPVWVFPGQGSQWAGMGRQLLEDEPAFATAIDELDPLFRSEAGFSLREVLEAGQEVTAVTRIQPVLFGVQVALAALWRSYGIEPGAVIGHSMGEVAAAVVTGAITPGDGLKVITQRSRLAGTVTGAGAMAVLELAPEEIPHFPGVDIAVHNAPRQTVVSGDAESVERLVRHVEGRGLLARLVRVDYASHSAHMDPLLADLREVLAGVRGGRPSPGFYSTVLDDPAEVPRFDADYWAANLRRPVRFHQAVSAALGDGHTTFVEISPHPVLTHAITETLSEEGVEHFHVLGTLRRDADETRVFHTGLGALQLRGDLPGGSAPKEIIDLPTTPWRHTRHWVAERRTRPRTSGALTPDTLLGLHETVGTSPDTDVWQGRLIAEALPYPGRHALQGAQVVPASVLVNTALAAAGLTGRRALANVRLLRPLAADRTHEMQVVAHGPALRVNSRSGPDGPWTLHLTAELTVEASSAESPVPGGDTAEGVVLDHAAVERIFAGRGVEGTAYPWRVVELTRTEGGLAGTVDLGRAQWPEVLDAVLQLAPLAAADPVGADAVYVPSRLGAVATYGVPAERVVIHVRQHDAPGEAVFDVTVTTPEGAEVMRLSRATYALLGDDTADAPERLSYELAWHPLKTPTTVTETRTVAVVGPASPLGGSLVADLAARGVRTASSADADVVVVLPPEPAESAERVAASTLDTFRELIPRIRSGTRLWLVTSGVREAGDAAALAHAPVWGLARVIAAEHPEIDSGIIDLDPAQPVGEVAALADIVLGEISDLVAPRAGERLAPRLVAVDSEPVRPAPSCRADAAYLITGGLGDLGQEVARWLASLGARRLLLAGRTPLPARQEWDRVTDGRRRKQIATVRELEAGGVVVHVVGLDVGDEAALREFVDRRDRDGLPPIAGVVHAAGVIDDRVLEEIDEDSLSAVLRPKIAGARALHQVFPPGDLDFLVLFSSAGAWFGVPGQGSYAAGNAFLDALARNRTRAGCHTVSIGWGAWAGLGFAASGGGRVVAAALREAGLRPLRVDEARTVWEHIHRRDVAHTLIVPGLRRDAATPADDEPGGEWPSLSPRERRERLAVLVGEELGIAPGTLDPLRPLAELGLDSVMAMGIRNRAERLAGLRIPVTVLWNHPTIEALAAYLDDRHTTDAGAPGAPGAPGAEEPGDALDLLLNDIERTP